MSCHQPTQYGSPMLLARQSQFTTYSIYPSPRCTDQRLPPCDLLRACHHRQRKHTSAYCRNGIAGVDNGKSTCCKAECGECGGVGCSRRGDDDYEDTADDCCVTSITESCTLTGESPCVMDIDIADMTTASGSTGYSN